MSKNDLRVFQFNLTTLFVVTTAMALVLAIFFSVGRLIGMSTMDVVTQGLVRFLYAVPTLLVWIVGLTLAIRHRKRNRLPATLTLIALGGLVLTTFIVQLVQVALIHSVTSNRISHEVLSWGLTFTGVLHLVVNTGCWILILMAIFAQRNHEPSASQRGDDHPNRDSE